jgi:peptidoglycan/xylan/chitin deacetylase (PgdA/CDA1 family)
MCLLLRMTGVPLLVRETLQRHRVTILVYHRTEPATADRHFEVLRHLYTPIGLQRFLAARRNSALDQLPPKPVIITIDDGHKSVHQLKPVLAKHHIPATVFLCSGVVGTNRRFWFSAPGLASADRQHLKTVPDEARLAALRAIGFDPSVETSDRESLDVSEVRDLAGLVDFQSHSVSHPILPACSDEKAAEEIGLSKLHLQTMLDLTVNALAYPNGSYGRREVQATRSAGYECGLTTRPGFNRSTTPAFELRRITIKDDCGINELVVRSCGLWAILRSTLVRVRALVKSDLRLSQRVPQSRSAS